MYTVHFSCLGRTPGAIGTKMRWTLSIRVQIKIGAKSIQQFRMRCVPGRLINSKLNINLPTKNAIEFATSCIVCSCTTLKNATTYTSSLKLLNKSAMHAVISLFLQSRKFW